VATPSGQEGRKPMAVDYTKRRPSVTEPVVSPPGSPVPPAGGAPAAPAGGVSLSKVTLTKAAPSVSLTKSATSGLLRVNLNWTARSAAPSTGGFFKRAMAGAAPGIDLDLGALYEFTDGSKGVVQALGNAFTAKASFTAQRVIWLDGDDRSGSNTGGENLFVNLEFASHIRRILVFASIYEGAANWAAANGVVTLFPASGPEVEVRLDEHDPKSSMCAIALIETTGSEVSVRREVRYIHGAQDVLDRTYQWGMNWSRGRK
jgi:tellurite resistance protein TerA